MDFSAAYVLRKRRAPQPHVMISHNGHYECPSKKTQCGAIIALGLCVITPVTLCENKPTGLMVTCTIFLSNFICNNCHSFPAKLKHLQYSSSYSHLILIPAPTLEFSFKTSAPANDNALANTRVKIFHPHLG